MWYKNGTVFNSQQSIRLDNPNTSLPSFISDAFIESLGYVKVMETEKPICTEVQRVEEDGILIIDGVPTRQWKVVNVFASEAEEEQYYADKAEAEAKALKTMFTNAIQQMLDAKAQEKGYDNIVSACSYAGYDNPFRAEGEAYGVWRANCWQVGYALLAEVQTGTKPMPTVEEVLELMPTLVLP